MANKCEQCGIWRELKPDKEYDGRIRYLCKYCMSENRREENEGRDAK